MKLYDWFIILMIGALIWGAYFVYDVPGALQSEAEGASAAIIGQVIGAALAHIAPFIIYVFLFRGPAADLRRHAAAAILFFITGLGIDMAALYLLFTGWADPNDLANREQLFATAQQFSRGILAIAALVFLTLCAFALGRRLSRGGAA